MSSDRSQKGDGVMAADGSGSGPLSGIRVLDAGQLVAGPFAASLLADNGADVVKVERPGKGDPLRALGRQKDGVSLWWHACNRNKRTIALDLAEESDRETFRRLASVADVLVENFVPGTLDRMGLGYAALAEANPRLIMLQVSAFGQHGPYSKWPGFARTSEAFSGLTHLTGYPDRPPVSVSAFPLSDYLSGVFGAFGVMTALRERDQVSGKGQLIDLALNEGIFRMMENLCVTYDQLGLLSQRAGGGHEQAYPVGVWPSADGVQISLAVGTEAMAARLFVAIGRPDLSEDPRFSTNQSRVQNREALAPIISEWIASRPAAEALQILGGSGVAVSPVMTMDAIFNDPHYAARGSLVRVADEVLGEVVMPAVVPKLSRTPGKVRHAAHAIDADRQQILSDWLPGSTHPQSER
jgi:crotonobetainyl-CoA:carnitine CoA-transferase CaiB-like acyl-CoA transferase